MSAITWWKRRYVHHTEFIDICHFSVHYSGFGSLLRAIGSQIDKTTNREMCRDLTGRRMRDVNNEKKLKDWSAKAGERAAEAERQRDERRQRRRELLKLVRAAEESASNGGNRELGDKRSR